MDETMLEKPTDAGGETTPQGLKSFGLPAEGDIVGDRYRIGKRIGVGGMGAVYSGTDLTDGAPVAVKAVTWGDESIAAQVIGRMRREGKLVAQIESPNVVRVVGDGIFLHGDMPMLAMEHLVGEDLHRVLHRVTKLPVDTVLKIGIQAARGLSAAHNLNIVHRDIKPPNLFLTCAEGTDELVVKILDFGIARGANPIEANLTQGLTQTGTILGSPTYMSPEQIQATSAVTPAADLWSLWVTLYQLISGATPHELERGSAVGSLLVKICATPAPPISDRVPTISRLVSRAFARGLDMLPKNRFQTAEEIVDELTRLVDADDATLRKTDIRPVPVDLETAAPHRPPPPPIEAAAVGWRNVSERAVADTDMPLQLAVEPVRAFAVVEEPKQPFRYDLVVGGIMLVGALIGVKLAISTTTPSIDANGDPRASTSGAPVVSGAISGKVTAPTNAPGTGVVAASTLLEGFVRVPAHVSIEVNGLPAVYDQDRIKIAGVRGSSHRVFMKRGNVGKQVIVTLTSTGPIPDFIDFPSVVTPK